MREAEDVASMEVPDLQVLVASWCWRSSLRLPDMEERDAFRELCAFVIVGDGPKPIDAKCGTLSQTGALPVDT